MRYDYGIPKEVGVGHRNIVVIGAGRRVVKDVLPALFCLEGISPSRVLIVRQSQKLVTQFADVRVVTEVQQIPTDFMDDCLVIACVPPNRNIDLLPQILDRGTPRTVLVDTPVREIASMLTRYSQLYGVEIRVLEDSHLIPGLRRCGIAENWSFTVFWRGLYFYHGSALISSIVGRDLAQIAPWWLMRYGIFVFSDRRGHVYCMIGGKHSPSAALLSLEGAGCRLRFKHGQLMTSTDLSGFRGLDPLTLDLNIEGDRTGSIRDIDELKRLGLAVGLQRVILDQGQPFPSVAEAMWNEELVRSSLDANEVPSGSRKFARSVRNSVSWIHSRV